MLKSNMIKSYILFCLIFILVDYLYLSSTASFFNSQIRSIQGSPIKLNMISTFLCYIFLTTGIFYFAIYKELTIIECALLGAFVYGVFETTSHAIFNKWNWNTVVIDTIWGAVLFSLTVFIHRKLSKYI
tara:strand:- start:489 stop:875 length:387 start_codon:yes stop_codon:yes gene_type:complete